MAKKKNKQIIRPWCWYCEREFEDEKVLMQHQKAKHFKCNMCPRRLNTAGGLAVHIQQVHKLEPENLPRIENALPGRDGYEVEIFGMEGIPAPDVADYKRRKEIELGLAAGSISQPPAKRPKTENRPMSEDELKAALDAHKALMGAANENSTSSAPDQAAGGVYNAPPQAYAVPPTPSPGMSLPPPAGPPGAPPFFPPLGLVPGQPPFPPFPGMPGFPPGPPPGFAVPPGFPPPPGMMPPGSVPHPGLLPPGAPTPLGMPGLPGAPARPPLPPPPTFVPQQGSSVSPPIPPIISGSSPSNGPLATPPPPSLSVTPAPPSTAEPSSHPTLPDPSLHQTNPPFKKPTELKYQDANFSPEELRAYSHKYYYRPSEQVAVSNEESRGKKRARAEDFL